MNNSEDEYEDSLVTIFCNDKNPFSSIVICHRSLDFLLSILHNLQVFEVFNRHLKWFDMQVLTFSEKILLKK